MKLSNEKSVSGLSLQFDEDRFHRFVCEILRQVNSGGSPLRIVGLAARIDRFAVGRSHLHVDVALVDHYSVGMRMHNGFFMWPVV